MNAIENDIVELNVSGVTEGFTVTKSLLRSFSGSYLDIMFSGKFPLQKVKNKIFINRDPHIFKMLL